MKQMLLIIAISVFRFSAFAQKREQQSTVTFNPNSGYINTTEIMPAIGLSNTYAPYSKHFIGIVNISGYQISFKNSTISRKLNLGIGTGVLFYNGGALLPLFLDIRFFMNERTITPFVFASGGGLIHFKDFDAQSRLFINPGIGARYAISETVALDAGTGVFVQTGDPGRDTFINFRLGISFKF